jgi:hypothetical protein
MGEYATYQITVAGKIDESWSTWFEGINIIHDQEPGGAPVTKLVGISTDQAALRGILAKVWNLNLTLLSVIRVDEGSG